MFSGENRKRWLFVLSVVILLCVTATTGSTTGFFNDPEQSTDNVLRAIAPWYDFAWQYRKPITINNSSGGALTDYQVQVTIDTETPIGEGKMQSNGADIRFTQLIDGTTLSYWIQSGINTDSTEIWVKVPTIPTGSSDIYIYYGNSGASAVSSLSNTFPNTSFADLFGDVSKVDGDDSSGVTVTTGETQLIVADTEVLDESQVLNDNGYSIYDNVWAGQTFSADFDGFLTKVTIRVYAVGTPPNSLEVQIRNATGGDLPGDTIYASGSRDDIGSSVANYDFTFGAAAAVTAGTKYAIVIKTEGGDASNNYTFRYRNADVYDNGRGCLSTSSGDSWTGYAVDLYFNTYITTASDLDQSQTVSNVDWQVYGDNLVAQSFLAGMSGDLTMVVIMASASGTPPNALTVEVQDAEEYIEEVMDQSQTLYIGNRSIYGNNWRAQTFRAGSSGDLSKITLRASKTGSPATDLIVELRDVTTGSQESEDQSQTLYTGGEHQAYGSNWWAQVFQAGMSGDLSKITLWASKTGSPATNLIVELRNAVEAAEENLDQSQTASAALIDVYGTRYLGQTFQAGISGELTKVTIGAQKVGSPPNALTVEIRNATGEDLPGTTVYATASRSDIDTSLAAYDFTFSSPADVVAGVKYAIVVRTDSGDSSNRYDIAYQNTDVYADGRASFSTTGGSSWTGYSTIDAAFRTYVTITDYIPGSTVYASTSKAPGDIGAAGEYEFTFGSPYSISSGTKYALVIYTSGGDASNYYGVSYEDSDAYADGRECSSTNGGTDWTGSSDSDLYFRTYVTVQVGDQPGSTVYASASKSPGDIGAVGDYDFVFASPPSITAETNYAIVIYTSGGSSFNRYNIAYQNSDAYSLGKEVSSSNGGGSWTPLATSDLYFKTYLSVATGEYLPGGTVYASASRSDVGSSAKDFEFFFSTPYTITSGTRYTIVFKTTGGDAANYYNVAYLNTDGYANGNQSSSTDGGSNWTTAADYDLYFKGYVEVDQAVSASGTLRSVTIPTDSATRLAVGIELSWNDTEPANTDIKYQLEYYDGSWALIPDGDLAGNSTGFDSSPVDVSSLIIDYGQIRLRANLSSTYSTSVPGIQDWTITYYYREYTSPEPAVTLIGDEE